VLSMWKTIVVAAGKADAPLRAPDEQHRLDPFDVDHGHTVDRRALVGLGGGLADGVAPDHEGGQSARTRR
jgi:hypothetical protein